MARDTERSATERFLAARDFLVERREDDEGAYHGFVPPRLEAFNWALDVFDVLAKDNPRPALWVVDDAGGEEKLSFAELSERSNQVANFLRRLGVRRGDRILLMLPNVVPLWEVSLAAMKLGAVIIPATTLLTAGDLRERMRRGNVRHVVADAAGAERFAEVEGKYTRIVAGEAMPGWTPFTDAHAEPSSFAPDGVTRADDPLLLYFTSGTTAEPKLVLHT